MSPDEQAALQALIGWALDEDHAADPGWLDDRTGIDGSAELLRSAAQGLNGLNVCPDCGGRTFWSEQAGDWLHEASDSTCGLASSRRQYSVTVRGFGQGVSTRRYWATSEADAERQALAAHAVTVERPRPVDR